MPSGTVWQRRLVQLPSPSAANYARYYLQELGGTNAPRLLLGGMLTDISVEHYHWVAGGDKNDPDPTTVTDRANLFLVRAVSAVKQTGFPSA